MSEQFIKIRSIFVRKEKSACHFKKQDARDEGI